MPWTTPASPGAAWQRHTAFAALIFLSVAGAVRADVPLHSPIYSRLPRFRIPYQLDPAEIARLGAVSIQLYVSSDHGEKWRLVDSVPAIEGKFTFEANSDGEYWFAVRTLGRQGDFQPPGPPTAGLIVVVDRTAPNLELDVSQGEDGLVTVHWSASDEHIEPGSLLLEFRDSNNSEWQTVQIEATGNGQTSWTSKGSGPITVRGRVTDKAGNEATRDEELNSPGSTPQPAPALPDFAREPIAEDSPPTNLNPFTPETARETSLSNEAVDVTLSEPRHPIIVEKPVEKSRDAAVPMSPPHLQSVPGIPARVNSPRFFVEYVLEEGTLIGTKNVELYLTENGGEKWFHYGTDQDASSPMEVEVPGDGTYGFTIRVRNDMGLAEIPPQPGEHPDLTVTVDQTPPTAELHPPRQVRAHQRNQFVLEWTVSDEELSGSPIALSFGETPNGPWRPITDWQPDRGRYLWTVSPGVPQAVYVRLQARDAAGNLTEVVNNIPLIVTASQPTSRMIGARTARQ